MIIADTHSWIWYVANREKLSANARKRLEEADRIGVSAISCWEIAMLVAKERLALNMDIQNWIEEALNRPKINLIPLSPKISILSTRLPGGFHGDPADQIIVATTLDSRTELVTKDQKIRKYKFVDTIW